VVALRGGGWVLARRWLAGCALLHRRWSVGCPCVSTKGLVWVQPMQTSSCSGFLTVGWPLCTPARTSHAARRTTRCRNIAILRLPDPTWVHLPAPTRVACSPTKMLLFSTVPTTTTPLARLIPLSRHSCRRRVSLPCPPCPRANIVSRPTNSAGRLTPPAAKSPPVKSTAAGGAPSAAIGVAAESAGAPSG